MRRKTQSWDNFNMLRRKDFMANKSAATKMQLIGIIGSAPQRREMKIEAESPGPQRRESLNEKILFEIFQESEAEQQKLKDLVEQSTNTLRRSNRIAEKREQAKTPLKSSKTEAGSSET